MSINYASQFLSVLAQKFAQGATSNDMERNTRFKWLNAHTLNIPTLQLSGYKDHVRDGSKNTGTLGNTYQAVTIDYDRDIQFYVDESDINETNMVLSAANITNTFLEEQAIPEQDAYRYSKLFAAFVAAGGTVDTTTLTAANILSKFDVMMEAMDEAGVPLSGRVLKVTPKINTLLKNAEGLTRTLDASGAPIVKRSIHSLDDVEIIVVPSDRMKSAYDFSNGFAPALTARQINMMLYHTDAFIATKNISDIYLWPKGANPDSAYGPLYQNRTQGVLYLITAKKAGVAINADAAA